MDGQESGKKIPSLSQSLVSAPFCRFENPTTEDESFEAREEIFRLNLNTEITNWIKFLVEPVGRVILVWLVWFESVMTS